MLPGLGYRVRTLHGLAHDIVRERPGLVNLANDFSIIDEGEANTIREQIAVAWLRANPYFLRRHTSTRELSEYQLENIRGKELPADWCRALRNSLIRYAKDCELTPEALRSQLDRPARPAAAGRNGLRHLPGIPALALPTAARSILTT